MLDQLIHPYKFHGRDMSGILFFIFASCEPLNQVKHEKRLSHLLAYNSKSVQRFSRAGQRGRGREWATPGVHPLSWLLSNYRLEEVCSTLTKGTFSSRLLLSNQDKGCTPSVAHSRPLPLGPALLNLSSISNIRLITYIQIHTYTKYLIHHSQKAQGTYRSGKIINIHIKIKTS